MHSIKHKLSTRWPPLKTLVSSTLKRKDENVLLFFFSSWRPGNIIIIPKTALETSSLDSEKPLNSSQYRL